MARLKDGVCCFCDSALEFYYENDSYFCDCAVCGKFSLSGTLEASIKSFFNKNVAYEEDSFNYKLRKQIISHYLAETHEYNPQNIKLTKELLDEKLKNESLPTPRAQFENLIYFLAKHQRVFSNKFLIAHKDIPYANDDLYSYKKLASVLGCFDKDNLKLIINEAVDKLFIKYFLAQTAKIGSELVAVDTAQLLLEGWNEFEQINNKKTDSKIAFLALKFNSAHIDSNLIRQLKDTVTETGFALQKLDDEQPAGLIDDNLRVKIRNSKFLIVDVSDGNNGAYWEAGYGEGLGKTVIYICCKEKWDTQTVHFDTNHHLTIIYNKKDEDSNEADSMKNFFKRLKATIRYSIPEAKQEN
ncbi:MAG: hypothetical protein FWG57_04840 [Endomicrobia bacterium]|nr:hypothetical protein [Endomicrobiia bacterium]